MYTLKLDHYKFEVDTEFLPVEPFLIWEGGGQCSWIIKNFLAR